MKTKTYKLIDEVLNRSWSDEFSSAVGEWRYKGSYIMDDYECACGKKHITEVNLIKNDLTGEHLELGSECIKKFLPVQPTQFFNGLKKIKNNPSASIGRKALKFVNRYNMLTYNELDWYLRHARTTKYDRREVKQTRQRLNEKIMAAQKNI